MNCAGQAKSPKGMTARAVKVKLEATTTGTAIDNISAQGLYEALGYERDTEFYKYSLAL